MYLCIRATAFHDFDIRFLYRSDNVLFFDFLLDFGIIPKGRCGIMVVVPTGLYFGIVPKAWYFGIVRKVWYYGMVPIVWYLLIDPTTWYFGIVSTVWYFGIAPTVWYFLFFY